MVKPTSNALHKRLYIRQLCVEPTERRFGIEVRSRGHLKFLRLWGVFQLHRLGLVGTSEQKVLQNFDPNFVFP